MNLPKGFISEEDEEFMKQFCKEFNLKDVTMVELGCYKGKSAVCWLESLNKNNGRLITIDRHQPFEADARFSGVDYVKNMDDRKLFLKNNLTHIIGDFNEVIKFFKMEIDALFIDGDHKYESVSKDFINWSPLVKNGGYLMFHDYLEDFHGVFQCVEEIKEMDDWKFIGVRGRIAIFKKK